MTFLTIKTWIYLKKKKKSSNSTQQTKKSYWLAFKVSIRIVYSQMTPTRSSFTATYAAISLDIKHTHMYICILKVSQTKKQIHW